MLALVGPSVHAHPGNGIVQDRRGNVYFTDLKQVWKITPDGKQSVAVPKVHTHELCLDDNDNLCGEDLWYEGDATKKWGHRVWRLKPDGSLSDIIPATGAERDKETVIKKRSPDGKPTTHASGDFRNVGYMTGTSDGTLYLMDSGDLRRISPDGKITTIAAKLSGQEKPPAKVSDHNYHLGLWTDRAGRVYVAVAAERLVVRVTTDGQSSVVARSGDPWSPSGGMVDRDGSLWLLEYDTNDTARARRIGKDGRDQVFTGESPRR